MKKKILVCGSTGFIGRNTAEAFARLRGYEVYGTYYKTKPFKNPNVKMIKADLTDASDVSRAVKGMDCIIQLAAVTSGAKDIFASPQLHVTDNAVMSALIFRSAFDNKVSHVIFPSCTTMYQSSSVPLKETDFDANKQIFSGYFGSAWTKIYNEKMCEFYSRIGDTKFTVIRHSNIYGPFDKFDIEHSHVFGATIAKVMDAKNGATITVWGEGKEKRDLLYISDLTDLFKTCLDKQTTKFELVNAGLGSSISVGRLVQKIITLSGKKLKIKHDISKPSIKTTVSLDISKAKDIFGWAPLITLDEGIIKTLRWYNKNVGRS